MPGSTHIQKAKEVLQKYWKYPEFRTHQERVISELVHSKSVIGLLPTGGGKSLCYQVPALIMDGITIVVSPLISLMEDQVSALKVLSIKAESIHSGHSTRDIDRILDNCIYGNIKLLYVSPERLSQHLFRERVSQMNISMVAIDEAHCISQWGHDFRPSYLQIQNFIQEFKPAYRMALTATATKKVIDEISKLIFDNEVKVVQDTFKRDNINISLIEADDKIPRIINSAKEGVKSIIYARNRRIVKMLAATLTNHNIRAGYYHAGMNYDEKKLIQEKFKSNQLDIVVATNAFGMGIDVSNVRRILHYDMPPSIEEYYQEIGRAGRDGEMSSAVFLVSQDDLKYNEERLNSEFPNFDYCKKMYKAIHVFFNIACHEGKGKILSIDYKKMAEYLGQPVRKTISILKLWQKLGVWEINDDPKERNYLKFNLEPRELRSISKPGEEHERLIDHLMRNYEQIFSEWVEVNISLISKSLKIDYSKIYSLFKKLESLGILKWYHMDAGPRLILLKDRLRQDEIGDLRKKYNFLKSLKKNRLRSMQDFINSETCRMISILKHFGERNAEKCGICDCCQSKSELSREDVLIKLQRDEEERMN